MILVVRMQSTEFEYPDEQQWSWFLGNGGDLLWKSSNSETYNQGRKTCMHKASANWVNISGVLPSTKQGEQTPPDLGVVWTVMGTWLFPEAKHHFWMSAALGIFLCIYSPCSPPFPNTNIKPETHIQINTGLHVESF